MKSKRRITRSSQSRPVLATAARSTVAETFGRALQAHDAGDLPQAARLYRAVLAMRPDHWETLYRLSVVEHGCGRPLDALSLIDRLVSIRPVFPEAHYNRGAVLHGLGRFTEALASYDKALTLSSDDLDARYSRGLTLSALKRFDEALANFDKLLARDADRYEAHFARGYVLFELGRFADALVSYDRALALKPDDAVAHNNRGNTLKELGRHAEALASFDRALALRPGYAQAHVNRANVLKDLERFDEAIAGYDRGLAVRANLPDALNNRGLALQELRRFAEALESFDRAVRLGPDHAEHRFNRAFLLLLLGNFVDGWREYEWRRKQKGWAQSRFRGPEWTGENISGRRVFLYGEQGLGDTILFARFARSVTRLGAEVALGTPARLEGLLRRLDCPVDIVRIGERLPEFDLHLPLLSVPFVLGFAPDSAPAETPYLSADPVLADRWSKRLPADGLRVGIAWQGRDKGRSIPLNAFAPLGRIPGVKLISLQKDSGVEELTGLPSGMALETLGADFDAGPDAFLDTAAVMMNLDLVVTCDTAVGHLAGALGRPVWIALRHVPDWRWMLDREDSPWYPTAQLFRQRLAGDWDEVFTRVAGELSRLAASRRAPPVAGRAIDIHPASGCKEAV